MTTARSLPALIEQTVGRAEASVRLERLGAAAQPVVARLVGTGRRRDLLVGRGAGHPAHPAAVTVPLGTWTAAGLLDAVGGRGGRRAAQLLVGVGVLGALPAAATGAADWLDTRGAERRVASAHAVGNHVALGLQVTSWALRRKGRPLAGAAASAVALGVATAAGFLGGHLVYRRGVGVNTTAFAAGPTEWTPIDIASPLVTGVPAATHVDGVAIVVVPEDDGFAHVLEDRCTHRGGPLHEGAVVDGCITCPWHQSRFDLVTGEVRAGPATAPQPVYEVARQGKGFRVRRAEEGALRRNPVR